MDSHELFLRDLQQLLREHKAELLVEDQWEGYPECGQDLCLIVEFDDFTEMNLGRWVDDRRYGAMNDKRK